VVNTIKVRGCTNITTAIISRLILVLAIVVVALALVVLAIKVGVSEDD